MSDATSRPEQKLGPSPCRTTARTPGAAATSLGRREDALEHRAVEGVVLVGPVEGDRRDVVGDVDGDALAHGLNPTGADDGDEAGRHAAGRFVVGDDRRPGRLRAQGALDVVHRDAGVVVGERARRRRIPGMASAE